MKHLLLISILLTGTLLANFKVGEKLRDITLLNQFDKESTIEAKDTLLIMAFEKDISVAISDYLKTKPSSFLTKNHTKYISDISSMPSLITSLFAMPKMKKYPFSVMLIRDDRGKQFNQIENKITVYTLKNHKIYSIKFITPKEFPHLFSD